MLLLSIAIAGPYSAQEKDLAASNAAQASKQCGAVLIPSFDWNSFDFSNKGADDALAYCRSVADGLYWTCDDDAGKAAVAGAIKGFTCIYDANAKPSLGKKGGTFALNDGVLEVRYHWGTTDIEDSTKEWVARTLSAPKGVLSLYDQRAVDKSVGYYGAEGQFKGAREACGAELPTQWDWPGFIATFGPDSNRSHDSAVKWCEGVYEGLTRACEKDKAKAAGIQRVRCVYDADATEAKLGRKGPALAVEGGTLEARYHWDTTDFGDTTRDWLLAR